MFDDLVKEFGQLVDSMDDLNRVGLEITPCDVQDTQKANKTQSVANFWVRAFMNHPSLSEHVSEKDRKILSAC